MRSNTQCAGDADKLPRCLKLLGEPAARGRPALIYAATRKKAEKVAEALRSHQVSARAYHAGLEDDDRSRVQEQFMAGTIQVVVATNAFGMGVDKRDVRLVIHHDLPGSAEAYYQEAGRAGRDGLPARCVLLFNHADVRLREFLIASPGDSGAKSAERQDAERGRLRAMMGYVYARKCRRELLLGYFGDPDAGATCSGCDVCDDRSQAAPLDDEEHLLVRKVLATVARLDGGFGRNRVALVLEGSTGKEVTDARLDRLGTYGLLRGRSHGFVLDLLGALEAAGLVVASRDEYPKLSLTRAGAEVMHDRQRAPVSLPSERVARRKSSPHGAPVASAGAQVIDLHDPLFQRLRGVRASCGRGAPAGLLRVPRPHAGGGRTRPAAHDGCVGADPRRGAEQAGEVRKCASGGDRRSELTRAGIAGFALSAPCYPWFGGAVRSGGGVPERSCCEGAVMSMPPPGGWQVPPVCGVPSAGSTQISPSSQSDITWQRSLTPCLQPASARGDPRTRTAISR